MYIILEIYYVLISLELKFHLKNNIIYMTILLANTCQSSNYLRCTFQIYHRCLPLLHQVVMHSAGYEGFGLKVSGRALDPIICKHEMNHLLKYVVCIQTCRYSQLGFSSSCGHCNALF
jgi:hypothetical protein